MHGPRQQQQQQHPHAHSHHDGHQYYAPHQSSGHAADGAGSSHQMGRAASTSTTASHGHLARQGGFAAASQITLAGGGGYHNRPPAHLHYPSTSASKAAALPPDDKVADVQHKPLSRSQKVENLQNCIDFLDRNGVQLNGLSTEELADGNLKSTLMLMNNIRRYYDGASQDHHPTSSRACLPPDPMDMPPPPGGGYVKPPAPHQNSTDGGVYQHGMTNGSTELLPGVLGKREEDPRPVPPPPNIVSTTQLDYNGGVSQHGAEQRRSHLPLATSTSLLYPSSGVGGAPLPARPHTAKPSSAGGTDIPPASAQQAWTKANHTSSNHKQSTTSQVREVVSLTVEERLRSLLSSSASSVKLTPASFASSQQASHDSAPARPASSSLSQALVNGGFMNYEDGELILPPPRGRRSHTDSNADLGSRRHHLQEKSIHRLEDEEEELFSPAYVPSQPSEHMSTVSRGQAILNRLQQHQQEQHPSLSSQCGPPRPPYPQEVSNMPGQYGAYSPQATQPPPAAAAAAGYNSSVPPSGVAHQQATSRASTNQPTPPPPRYQPPPQYGQRHGGSSNSIGGNVNPAYQMSPQLPAKSKPPSQAEGNSDLRNACSRIYGDNIPSSRLPAGSAGLVVYTNNQGATSPYNPPMWPKYGDPSTQPPRTSPMGQSASTPSQGSHSPSSPSLPTSSNMHTYSTSNSASKPTDTDYKSKHDALSRLSSNSVQPHGQPRSPARPGCGIDFAPHSSSEQQHRAGSVDLASHLSRGSMDRRSQGGVTQQLPGLRSSSAEHPGYPVNSHANPALKSLDRRPSVPGNLDARSSLTEGFGQVPPPLPQRNHPNGNHAEFSRLGAMNGPSDGKVPDGPKRQTHNLDTNANQSTVMPNGVYSQLQQHIREHSRSNESRDWSQKGGDQLNQDHPDMELKVLNSDRSASRAVSQANSQLHPHQSHYSHNNNKEFHSDEYADAYDIHTNLAHKMAQVKLSTSKWQSDAEMNSREHYASSISSSRSVTPPLPPLSPSNTPPLTPPHSPHTQQRHLMGKAAGSADFLQRTPDVVTSTSKKNSVGGKRKTRRSANAGITVRARDSRQRRNGLPTKAGGKSSPMKAYRQARSMGSLDQMSDDSAEEYTVEESVTAASGTEDLESTVDDGREIVVIRRQLEGLESMYVEILRLLGVDREYAPGSRNSISSQSTVSRTGRSRMRRSHHSHQRKEIRQVNKRFQRLESHVVTLARSVAHLSSEMRGQATINTDMDEIKQDIKRLKEVINSRGPNRQAYLNEFERFRGWVPSLSNPRRVNKLTKFFGQEPPFLHIFLKKLGYERYIPNFDQEKISLIELPYMNEDRLQKIGIPMGPRLRILQEAQMCFRQENFDIYIV